MSPPQFEVGENASKRSNDGISEPSGTQQASKKKNASSSKKAEPAKVPGNSSITGPILTKEGGINKDGQQKIAREKRRFARK